jgi:hypothetical protein
VIFSEPHIHDPAYILLWLGFLTSWRLLWDRGHNSTL